MKFLKTSALVLGLAALGVACGSDSGSNNPDAPIVGGTGGAGGGIDAAIPPATGGAGGTTGMPLDSGMGGGMDSPIAGSGGFIDSGAGGSMDSGMGGIDSGAGGSAVQLDSGAIDSGSVADPKATHIGIINTVVAGGLDVTGPTPVPYATCK